MAGVRDITPQTRIPKPNPVIGMLGAYLNPEVQDRLRRLAEQLDRLAASRAAARPSGRADRKLQAGLVPQAIMRVLAGAAGPLKVAAIHEAVEDELEQPVPRSTIKNCLAQQAQAADKRLVRLGHGRYCLMD